MGRDQSDNQGKLETDIYNPGQNYVGQACRMHCLDNRSVSHMETNVLWAKYYFPPLSPCNAVRKERLADESSNIAWGGVGGEGGTSESCSNSGKTLCPTHFGQDCLYHALSLQTHITRSVWNVLSPNLCGLNLYTFCTQD